MTLNFGISSERGGRGRGKKQSRVVPFAGKAIVEATLGASYQEELTRKEMTPNQLALSRLNRELGKFSYTQGQRYTYLNWLPNMEQLRHMNMQTLAGAIVLYEDSKRNPEPVHFTDEQLEPIINRLLPIKFSERPVEEQQQIRAKYKQSLLRYIRTLIFYQQRYPL